MSKFNLATVQNDLKSLRAEITDLKEEKVWIESSTLPKGDLIQAINAKIDADAGISKIDRDILSDRIENVFMSDIKMVEHGSDADLGPLLCLLFGDEIKQKLAARINTFDYEAGPPKAERRKLIEDIDKRLFEAETEEENLIEQAEQQGVTLARRREANAAVVFGLVA